MISFCKHFLHAMNSPTSSPNPTQNHSSSNAGLCLIASGGCEKATNVVESIAVAKTEKKSSSGFLDEITRTVSSSGFLDEIGSGAVDGLSSCTESLGFESSDQMEEMTVVEETKTRSTLGLSFRKASRESSRWRERVKNLPPPLSSLNRNGESNYFMKAVRENGRLVLTEVTIDRPEIFVASRQDGRLTLQLIKDEEEEDDVDESELESDIEEEEEEKVEEEEEEEEKEEERIEWRMPVTSGGGGEGFRRCHELSTRNYQPHHHQHVPMWNHHQCVTTR